VTERTYTNSEIEEIVGVKLDAKKEMAFQQGTGRIFGRVGADAWIEYHDPPTTETP
jgi:hypothetical protein